MISLQVAFFQGRQLLPTRMLVPCSKCFNKNFSRSCKTSSVHRWDRWPHLCRHPHRQCPPCSHQWAPPQPLLQLLQERIRSFNHRYNHSFPYAKLLFHTTIELDNRLSVTGKVPAVCEPLRQVKQRNKKFRIVIITYITYLSSDFQEWSFTDFAECKVEQGLSRFWEIGVRAH